MGPAAPLRTGLAVMVGGQCRRAGSSSPRTLCWNPFKHVHISVINQTISSPSFPENKKNYRYLVLREVNSDYQYIRTRLYYNGTDLYRFNNVLKNIVSDDEKDILIKKGSDLLKSNGFM